MKRKRIKYVANIDFGYRSITDAKQYIKIFLKSLLSQIGLQLGIDYIVTANHLRIRHVKNITGKITTMPHGSPALLLFFRYHPEQSAPWHLTQNLHFSWIPADAEGPD